MKKIIIVILAVFLGSMGVALAAPYFNYQRTILPETNNGFDLGTSTAIWRNLFLTNLRLSTTTSGCLQSTATGIVWNTGTACGTGGGEANTASTLGTGRNLFDSKSGVDLRFNSLAAGTNVTLSTTSNNNTIVIASTASGSGTDAVSTSTNETAGALSYWTSNSATSALLGKIATTTLTGTAPMVLSQPISVIGGSASVLTCNAASGSQAGCLASADWTTFNNKGSGTVTSVNMSVPAGLTISEMGIVGNNLDDFSSNVNKAREATGKELGNLTLGIEGKATVNLERALSPLDDMIEEAQKTPETNKAVIERLQSIKNDLINYIGPDNKNLTFAEAIDAKGVVGKLTKWTGNPSDDKLVNKALKQIYGTIDNEVMKKIGLADPEVAKQIINLNDKYGNLITAESAINHRAAVAQRLASIGMPIKVGTTAGLITAIATGGAAIPALLTGVGVGILDQAMGSTAVKSRIAAWLGSETPSVVAAILQKILV